MSITFKDSRVAQFYNHNIEHPLKFAEDKFSLGKFEDARGYLNTVVQEVANAKAAFPSAREDLAKLDNLTQELGNNLAQKLGKRITGYSAPAPKLASSPPPSLSASAPAKPKSPTAPNGTNKKPLSEADFEVIASPAATTSTSGQKATPSVLTGTAPPRVVSSKAPSPTNSSSGQKPAQPVAQSKLIDVRSIPVTPEMMTEFRPVGIRNIDSNCWANALLQLFANTSIIATKILERIPTLAPQIRNYYEAQLTEASIAKGVDSQKLRESCTKAVPKKASEQEDAMIGFEEILDKIGFHYSFKQVFDYGIFTEESTTVRREHTVQLDMMQNTKDFRALWEGFFAYPVTLHEQPTTQRLKFEKAPEELFIQAKRYGQDESGRSFYVGANIEKIPERLDVDSSKTQDHQPAHYEFSSCVIYKGNGREGGHYVAVLKKPDGWYLADDHEVSKIEESQAKEWLKEGYIFHYRKVEARPAQHRAPNVPPLPPLVPVAPVEAPAPVQNTPPQTPSDGWGMWATKGTIRATAVVGSAALSVAWSPFSYLLSSSNSEEPPK